MDGFDLVGAEYVGFDWMNLAKAGAGALQGAGTLMSSGGGGGGKGSGKTDGKADDKAIEAAKEKQRLDDERKATEASASRMKLALGIGGGFLAALGLAVLVRK